ncbi:MAG: hypothetical protein IKS94_04055, partial [Prevotella sp.]|nr:hypothetical protein [Prevotella sp.]
KPPWLTKLIYHDLGADKEFIGAKIKYGKYLPDDAYGRRLEYFEKEIRLPDEIANEIIDMVAGDTKFVPGPALAKMFQTTKSPNLIKEHEL